MLRMLRSNDESMRLTNFAIKTKTATSYTVWPIYGPDIAKHERHAIVDGPFGASLKKEEFVEDGVPVIRINNIRADGFHEADFVYITNAKYEELRRSKVHPEDLLIARVGHTIGKACIFDQTYKAFGR